MSHISKAVHWPVALTCSLVLLSACSERVSFLAPKFQMGPNNAQALVVTPDGDVHESGKLTVSIRGFLDNLSKKRRLLATLADVEKVVVEVSASGLSFSQTIEKADINSGTTSATFTGIPEGAATVTMKAYNASNQLIGQASKATSVTAGNTTTVEIQLQLDPTYTQPPTGGGSSNTGSITANGTIIDGGVFNTYPLAHSPGGIAVDGSGKFWVANSNTTQHLSQFAADGTFTSHFDGGSSMGSSQVAFDSQGNIWTGGYTGIQKWTPDAQALLTPTLTEETAGEHLNSLAVDPFDAVWVHWAPMSFGALHVVSKFGPDGTFLAKLTPGPEPKGDIQRIAVDSQGQLWVCGFTTDSTTGTVTISTLAKYSPTGEELGVYQLPAGSMPYSLAIDSQDHVWVCLTIDGQVMKFAQDGTVLGTYKAGDVAVGIALDTADNAWVVGGESIAKLSPDGSLVALFALPPTEDPYVGMANSLAAGSSGVWVVDQLGQQLHHLAP